MILNSIVIDIIRTIWLISAFSLVSSEIKVCMSCGGFGKKVLPARWTNDDIASYMTNVDAKYIPAKEERCTSCDGTGLIEEITLRVPFTEEKRKIAFEKSKKFRRGVS